nr:immunoglobulin heavy chain junction region [Macaca mulatta]MOV54309.1 immunoglobulin heavy chain junction region [Macaca mulatta]MOV54762.1 immunoglobulin heavy chain junction region [Macaca mulatta]MOV55951.1 immunoglobulin heavy chain junction region [Macaca mulatta]MOV57594.1 immunoglobulin heavy chain junction region [Macaca mulatta]
CARRESMIVGRGAFDF